MIKNYESCDKQKTLNLICQLYFAIYHKYQNSKDLLNEVNILRAILKNKIQILAFELSMQAAFT